MTQQLHVMKRSLERTRLFNQAISCHTQIRYGLTCMSFFHAYNSSVLTRSRSFSITHQSVITHVPNLQALQHLQWLLHQSQRRVLFLTGSSASDSSVQAILERDLPIFELERCGHGIFTVREFCQLLLRESGHERRVLRHAQLAALLMHHIQDVPGVAQYTATSTLQRRKIMQDLLQFFQLLEREGITPDQYSTVVCEDHLLQGLSETYRRYQELLTQHNVTSWDGLVLNLLMMCGVQTGDMEDLLAKNFSRTVMREYTDVVVDDVQRMTPAMVKVVGHLCGQSSVQTSTSFSRVLLEGETCFRTLDIERQLLLTTASTGQTCTLNRAAGKTDHKVLEKKAPMQLFARQVLKHRGGNDSNDVPAPVPLKCWRVGTSEAEEKIVGALLAQKVKSVGALNATVFCPTHADAHRIALAFQKQGLPAQIDGGLSGTSISTIHLFDEPGVNTVYSLMCALCFPSDSRHLYNVLRSECFAFPAELLSWLMETEHRGHVGLFAVLESFVESHGKLLGTCLGLKEGEKQKLPQTVSHQIETGLAIAESFVNIIKRLRTKCHEVSAAEIVQTFLEETGRLETLLSPSSSEEERKSLALADFLRELETAQEVAMSDQVTFVVPYLQQLRKTNLTSSASWVDTPDVASSMTSAEDVRIQVLPLTPYALHSYGSSVSDCEESRKHVLVIMSMRDSKFPGRMKRLTLPLPYELLSKPYPVQSRSEHLEQCEQLAYEALTIVEYDEVVLSFAELTTTSSSKREVLSRTFKPIWHEGDKPALAASRIGGRNEISSAISPLNDRSVPEQSTVIEDTPSVQQKGSTFWFSDMADLLRNFVHRAVLPVLHRDHQTLTVDVFSRTKTYDDDRAETYNTANAYVKKSKSTSLDTDTGSSARSPSIDTRSQKAPALSASFDPPHLSYSQISEYLHCPHRYYLSRIVKLNGDISSSMMFGRALHEGIAAFAKSLVAAQLNEEAAHDEMKVLAAAKAKDAFMQSWSRDGDGLFASKEQSSFFFDRGMAALYDFIETHFSDVQLEEIVHVEQAFSFYVPGADVELRGVWDRIDRVSNPSDGRSSLYVIKEFKSNMSNAERNMDKLAGESLQLKLYMYAFCKVFGEPPHGAKLQQIGDTYSEPSSNATKTRRKRINTTGKDDNGFVIYSEKAVQEANDAIVEVASGLRRGNFEPKPSFAECAFCPYAGSACHFATDDALRNHRQSARKTCLASHD